MSYIIHELSDWVLSFAESQWAVALLGLSSFMEAIIFPIPPDPLLIAIGLVQQESAIFLGLWVAITSVAGAIVGHWIGKRLGRPIIEWAGNYPILDRFFSHNKVDKVERLFKRYGIWTILIAAFTPLPYKVFAITAGILQMDRRSFIIASIIGRSARFLTIGLLIALFGQEIESIMSNNFELITVSIAAITIIGVMGWIWFKRTHRRTSSTLR